MYHKSSLCCTLVSRSVGGCFGAYRGSRRQYANKIQVSDSWVTHCRLPVFPTHLTFFLFSCFNSRLKPLNRNVGVKARTWRLSSLQAFSSAVDRLACLWQDLCRLRRGTSLFVVRIPLNIFHRNNYHTICSFLPACCSLSACQLLLSPSFSLPLPHTHSLTH